MKGDVVTLKTFLQSQTVIESASALQTFIRDMKQPIIPMRVQKLVLADNPGIPETVVASDAFGLLQQELTGLRLELLLSVLELIYLICYNSIRSELTCISLPITILPTFFDTKLLWSQKWQKAATRFHEIIIKTPECVGRMNRSVAHPDPLARYRSYIRLIRQRILVNNNNYY